MNEPQLNWLMHILTCKLFDCQSLSAKTRIIFLSAPPINKQQICESHLRCIDTYFYFCLSVSVAKCSSNVNLIVIWKLEPVLILQFGVEQTKAAEYIQKLVWSSARRWMWRPSIFGLLCNSGMIGWPLVLCKFVFIYFIMSKISVVLAPWLLFHSFWFLLFVLSNDLAQLSELISVLAAGTESTFHLRGARLWLKRYWKSSGKQTGNQAFIGDHCRLNLTRILPIIRLLLTGRAL